jgi:hypothetical protein
MFFLYVISVWMLYWIVFFSFECNVCIYLELIFVDLFPQIFLWYCLFSLSIFFSANKYLLVLQNNFYLPIFNGRKNWIDLLITNISHEDEKREREKICSFFRFWKCNNNLPKIVLQNFVILFKNNTGFLLNLKNI